MNINFGREICGELNTANSREWLVTNGIGGYASGTVAGTLTRSYHGVLIAALNPPLNRVLLVTKIDETINYLNQSYPLFTNLWKNGVVDPFGNELIQSFILEDNIPTWSFTFADVLLEKRIWLHPQSNTTYVYYTVKRSASPVKISLKALVNYRSHHGGELPKLFHQSLVQQGVRLIMDTENNPPFYIFTDQGTVSLANERYTDFQLLEENYRGLNDLDDHLHVATFEVSLKQGSSLTVVATTENHQPLVPNSAINVNDSAAVQLLVDGSTALNQRRSYEQNLINLWQQVDKNTSQLAPDWIKQLVLAANQFIVDRPLKDGLIGKSVIAGYHWFEDWGRDTMISLPGLALVTGHPEIARKILETFAESIDHGMLPNRFPDTSELTDADYNTVDATLWFFIAIRAYYNQTKDDVFIQAIFPKLQIIIQQHQSGTRYNIKLDPTDGLISAGAAGVQLTWMDALVNNQVITPRRGKPIEINALWYNALIIMSDFAKIVGQPPEQYARMADTTKKGFARFWQSDKNYCFDVIDVFDTPNLSDGANDSSLRPNQLFAVSLPESPLNLEQQKKVVDICEQFLWTSHGLRSLDPNNYQYIGKYGGNQYSRDSAYHQGTIWSWLIAPFALAHLRVYDNPAQALTFLEPIAYHLHSAGLGSISEIFEGDPPYRPRGCIAQAWSVAEVLRAWTEINQKL
jgi:predicted glycogen debranching enzyme